MYLPAVGEKAMDNNKMRLNRIVGSFDDPRGDGYRHSPSYVSILPRHTARERQERIQISIEQVPKKTHGRNETQENFETGAK